MKTKEILELIEFISRADLNEVNIETPEFKVFVKKKPDVVAGASDAVQPAPVISHLLSHTTTTPGGEIIKTEPGQERKINPDRNYKEIRSPMIGTFYQAANPETPPFIKVGDKINKGQTVCIIEAMKLFNEIESEISGTVVEILAENATPVEYDQPLFLVDPA